MSFSVQAVGSPEAIKRVLAKQSEALTGQSKEEFDAVRPAIEAIIDQNVSDAAPYPYALRLEASGHASFKDGKKTYGVCTLSLTNVGVLAV